MTDPGKPTDKTELLQHMDESWLKLNDFVEPLTPEQLTEPTDDAGWSVRDHLAHLAAWEHGMIAVLHRTPRHEGMGVEEDVYLNGDIDSLNEALRESTSHVPATEVYANLAETHQELRAEVEKMPDDHLQKPYTWFLPDEPGADSEQPIINRISMNTGKHFEDHMGWMEGIIDLSAP